MDEHGCAKLRVYADGRWVSIVELDAETWAAIQSSARLCGYNGAACLWLARLIRLVMRPAIVRELLQFLGRGGYSKDE